MIVFTTPRTIVRHLELDDFDALYRLCSNPDVVRWMDEGQPLSPEQTRKWIAVSQGNYQRHGFGCMAVVGKEQQEMIGFCGLIYPPETSRVEIIYAFLPDRWGQGYATEVGQAMLDWGLQERGLSRIEATIDSRNPSSSRAAEKMGMRYERTTENEDGSQTRWYVIERAAVQEK